MTRSDVLIIGAGPTGLVLALWLTRLGVKARIIDQTAVPGTTSRALAIQARTLELYRQLGLTDAVLTGGHRVPAVNLWVRGRPAARIAFQAVGADLTPYSFLEIFPQDRHEQLLLERLGDLGVSVERETELAEFTEAGGLIAARLRRSDGAEERCEARYLAGCDGARSRVRERLGIGFPGGTYRQLFYVADIDGGGPPCDGELHVDLDEADFLAVFPLADAGRARLVGAVRDARADQAETLAFADVSTRAMHNLKLEVHRVNWFSTYHVHHRVAAEFSRGRAFLLGDAAHVHSPVGGQGMNTGIGDAINLAWKLAAVLAGGAPESLLASYQAERIAFARRLVATTDRVFSFVTADGGIADFVRTRLAPRLIPKATTFAPVREFLFRTVSQITLNYRGSALSSGSAGAVRGGDRLPWVRHGDVDNFTLLEAPGWQAHVYGEASERLAAWCERARLPLHVLPHRGAHQAAGLARDALYLLRPDTYVALADPRGDPGALERYFSAREFRLPLAPA
jgi:2-polyprenyl-6-methoxyphenol hydroxylase-like FAD-dependent oxidoreductase